jgi:hypothetical protein
MRTLLATTFTVLAASGCAAQVSDPVDDEPPPSSRPIKQKHVADAAASPTEKDLDITKPGDPRPGCPPPTEGAWPDGDPKSDPTFAPDFHAVRDDACGIPNPPTGFAPDFSGGPSDAWGFPNPPTGFAPDDLADVETAKKGSADRTTKR